MDKFLAALTAAAEYYGHETTPAGLAIMADALAGHDEDQLIAALRQHIRQSQWFPKASELLEIIHPPDLLTWDWGRLQARYGPASGPLETKPQYVARVTGKRATAALPGLAGAIKGVPR